MQTLTAIDHMIRSTGQTKAGVSAALGKHRNFLSTTFYKQSIPQADTLANIAHTMGYKLVLVGNGEEIEIDPTIELGDSKTADSGD